MAGIGRKGCDQVSAQHGTMSGEERPADGHQVSSDQCGPHPLVAVGRKLEFIRACNWTGGEFAPSLRDTTGQMKIQDNNSSAGTVCRCCMLTVASA